MRLRTLFFLLGLLLILAWSILLFFTLNTKSMLLYVGEGVISFSLIVLFYFYRKVVKPLNSIASGMDLLREQDFSSRLASVGQAEADRIVEMFNRMMDQLKNERLRLREQNHFLDLLINVSPMGVIILTFDEQRSMLNAKIYRCSRLSFVDRGFAHPFILVESLTTEVVKAEKKAYEKVIRMIAHEVNNTTAGITSTLETVGEALETLEEETNDLQEVMKVCVERCWGMSQFITKFADVVKIPDPNIELVRLNDRVIACGMFMETICRERQITLHNELCMENPKVWIDTVLFEQVLVNIIKNAAESIGQGGDIFIRTSVSPVMLEIADSGKGISKEVETKLFSPFFSTKPNGQGIGLIFIREVLTRLGCTFSLRTYADGLTRFRISFPERRPEQGKDTDKYTL